MEVHHDAVLVHLSEVGEAVLVDVPATEHEAARQTQPGRFGRVAKDACGRVIANSETINKT